MKCGDCNEPVVGEHTLALGKIWHPNHFCCKSCGKNLSGDFFDHSGTINCRSCAEKVFKCSKCNKLIEGEYYMTGDSRFHASCIELFDCHKCGKTITGSEMVAIGRHYHIDCFTCGECGTKLPSRFYNRDGTPVCESCSNKTAEGNRLFCSDCSKSISETYVSYEGKTYHDECFKCYSCKVILPIDDFYNVKGNPHCLNCAKIAKK